MDKIAYVSIELEDLIPNFISNRKKDIEILDKLIKEEKFEEIENIGHSMKGVGMAYGFDYISEIGLNIEFKAKEENKEEILKWINELKTYMSEVKIELITEEY